MTEDKAIIAKIKQITSHIKKLPTLPSIAAKIIEMVNDPKVSATKIGNVISADQALTAKILKLVNSAYYGFPRKISTISHAIVILGFNTLRDLVLSTTLFDVFTDTEDTEGFNRQEFWTHSIGCAVASRMLARTFRYRVAGELFVSGLLHDIGKLIFDQYFHDFFVDILAVKEMEQITMYKAEKRILGIGHPQLGKWLAEEWNLPKEVVSAVAYHHDPENAPDEYIDVVSIVHFANILVKIANIGYGGTGLIDEVHSRAWETLKLRKSDLNVSDIETFVYDLNNEIQKADAFLNLAKT